MTTSARAGSAAVAATTAPLTFRLSRWSPNLLVPTTSFVKASIKLITRPPHHARTGALTIARGRARVNVVSHTRAGWERHRRVGHATRARAVVARVAEISRSRIITHGTAAPAVFAVRPGLTSPVPTDAGRALGRARPALIFQPM